MTDWAAKVLEGVPRHYDANCDRVIMEADALAAIAKLAEGDGLVAELEMSARIWTIAADHKEAPTFSRGDCRVWAERFTNAAAHIAALTAKIEELRGVRRDDALELLAAHGQAQEAYATQLAAEAEAAALRAKVARLEGALTKAANRLDWAAGIIEIDKARDQVGGWADEARVALTDGGKNE